MITNKDIRVENGNLVLNGDKIPLDGQSPETIMEIVEDNSDTTPTENSTAPITSGGVYTALGTKQDTLTFDDAPTENSSKPVKSGGIFTAIANAVSVINEILGFTHFVRIPYTTGVLESIEAAFEDGTIPVDIMGLTIGMVRGQAGSQRVVFIAQNQTDPNIPTQTRYAAIYFGAYTAPRFCQKQDGVSWTDVAL